MGVRGQNANTKLKKVDIAPKPRIKPPSDLKSSKAKRIWKEIVDSMSAEHFKSCDKVIMVAYCNAYVDMLYAKEKLDEEGWVIEGFKGPQKNPWVDILRQNNATLATFTTKLRLCPSAREMPRSLKTMDDVKPSKSGLGSLLAK